MAEPAFLSGGDTPRRTDTRWTEAVRWLGQLQNMAGADAANNPRRTDSFRDILYKIARATNSSIPCGGLAPSDLEIFDGSPAADWTWERATDPAQDFLLKWGTVSGGPYTESEAVSPAIRAYGLVAVPGTYFGVIVARDSDSCTSNQSSEVEFTIT